MKDKNNSYNSTLEGAEEVLANLKTLWGVRKLIFKVVGIFFAIGCVVALSSPVLFQSETTFVPQIADQSSSNATKGLSSLASLAGVNLNAEISSSVENYLSPLLYSRISIRRYYEIPRQHWC